MLSNTMIVTISIALAGICLFEPVLARHAKRPSSFLLVAIVCLVALLVVDKSFGTNVATAILLLSTAFSVLGEVLIINFDLVSRAHYPKNRRCY